jgi:hypothetical protein
MQKAIPKWAGGKPQAHALRTASILWREMSYTRKAWFINHKKLGCSIAPKLSHPLVNFGFRLCKAVHVMLNLRRF